MDFINDDCLGEAAALSFYTLLSLAPLLLLVVGVAGRIWGDEAATGELARQAQEIVGPEAAGMIQVIVASAAKSAGGPIALSAGLVTLLFGATGALVRLKAALNRIWGVADVSKHGPLWRFLHTRLESMVLVLLASFLLVTSLGVSTLLAAQKPWIESVLPWRAALGQWEDLVMVWFGIALLIVLIYRYLPDPEVSWQSAATGALATTVFFVAGRTLVGIYIERAGFSTAYGGAGSLIVLLVWIYYSSLSLLLGAEVAKVSSHRRHPRRS